MNQVSFVGVEPSAALREYIDVKLRPLALEPEVRSWRVVIERQSYSHTTHRFRAKIEIAVPHRTLVVGSRGEVFEDVYAAVDASCEDAKRAIHEHASRARVLRRHA